jgi:hypothetical protein
LSQEIKYSKVLVAGSAYAGHLNCISLLDSNWKEKGAKNPKKALDFLNNYEWSSYLDYRGVERPQNKIITPNDFQEFFQSPSGLDREMFDWLEHGKEDIL